MEVYNAMREFADSWGLLGMSLFFVGAIVYALRPAGARHAEEAARIPFEDENS